MLSLEERNDHWQNMLSGLGTARDKSTHSHLASNEDLPTEYLEQLYQNDDMAARIIDLVPNEITRQGIEIIADGKNLDLSSLQLNDNIKNALVASRLYGSAFIYLGINDGLKQDVPINKNKTHSLDFMNVLSAKDIRIHSFYGDPAQSKFGNPEFYSLNDQTIIHENRLIPFYGTSFLSKKELPKSILQRIYPVLQQFHTAWQTTAHLMTDAAQGVFKLKGLHSAVAANRSAELLKRMELVDISRSVSRSILLDAEDEDFRRDPYSFAGIPQILEKMMFRLSAAARIPVSLLMGQAPAGMNATGESDIRFFYDQVRAEQEAIKPKIKKIITVFLRSKYQEISINFPALWQMSEKEKADIRRIEAETDRIYLQEGVVLPEEIALQRFNDKEISHTERYELLKEETKNDE